MLHCLIIFSTFCGVSFYVAHLRPAMSCARRTRLRGGFTAYALACSSAWASFSGAMDF